MTESEIQKITTIATPYYNTPKALFEKYLKHVKKFDCEILIVNDGSDEEHTKTLVDLCQDEQFKIVHLKENIGIMGISKELLKHIETEFFIRVDADDLLLNFPWNKGLNPDDIDGIIVRKSSIDITDVLKKSGGSPHGSLYRTSVFEDFMSRDKFDTAKHDFIHEDMYWHFWLLSESSRLVTAEEGNIYQRIFHSGSITAGQIKIPPRINKYNTFYLWSVLNSTPEYYREIMYEVLLNQDFGVMAQESIRLQKEKRGMK